MWKLFYWASAIAGFTGSMAIIWFGWKPDSQTVAWAAFFAIGLGAHSIARQSE